MKPYYEHGGITIYHGDCRDVAPALSYQAVVSDPPYGMNWDADSTRFSGGGRKRGEGRADWGAVTGDDMPFDPSPWITPPHVVLFGANHYAGRLPVGTWLVWLKKAEHLYGTFLSDAEVAWRKGGRGVYAFSRPFPNATRAAESGGRAVHPTQKPVAVMRWAIEKSGAPEDAVILDPYMGSGTTLVAAKNLGRRAIGIEVEERYCEIAAKRLSQEVLDFGGVA